jgi:hypothetical protein
MERTDVLCPRVGLEILQDHGFYNQSRFWFVEGEGRGGVFEESGVGVGAIVSSSSSSTSVISLLALSFFNNAQ